MRATISVNTVVYSTRTIGIVVSSAIAIALVIGAVLLSGPLPFLQKKVNAETTHELLVQYASKDTDSDGLPDWEESLYGTDPNNPHSVDASTLDGAAVAQGLVKPRFANATTTADLKDAPGIDAGPQTLTDQFAREFFAQYLANHGGPAPTPEEVAKFVEDGVATLSDSQTRPNAYNLGQVKVSGTGPDAVRSYIASVQKIYFAHVPQGAPTDMTYLSALVHQDDTTVIPKLKARGTAYTAIARELIALPVPKELVNAHLAFTNATASGGLSVGAFAVYTTDPLRTLLAVGQFAKDINDQSAAVKTIIDVAKAEGVALEEGDAGYEMYVDMQAIANQQTP